MSNSVDFTEDVDSYEVSVLLILDPHEFRERFAPALARRRKLLAAATNRETVSSFETLMEDSLWISDQYQYTELTRLALAVHLFWTYTRTEESVSQVHEKIEPLLKKIKKLIFYLGLVKSEVDTTVDAWYERFQPRISQLNHLRSVHTQGVVSTIPGIPEGSSLRRSDSLALSQLGDQPTGE